MRSERCGSLARLFDRVNAWVGPWDDAFSFSVPRTVRIRDWRLGCSLLAGQAAIALYVVLYVLILQQAYLTPAALVGSVRLQLRAPSAAARWPGGRAPYCLGTTPADLAANAAAPAGYAVLPDARYSFRGAVFPQRPCRFADSFSALPLAEASALFLPTEARVTVQAAQGGAAACANLTAPACAAFLPEENRNDAAVTQRALLADAEFYTLRIDHNVAAPGANIAKTARALAGRMLSARGEVVDACEAYRENPGGAPCPDVVALGVAGKTDTVSIATLLAAAGVPSLDAPSAESAAVSLREGGLILFVDVSYSNALLARGSIPGTGSLNAGTVEYTLRVSALTDADFKLEEARALKGPLEEGARALFNRHGVRVLFSQSGFLGRSDLQTFIVNAVTALGLLALAVKLVEAVAFNCWRLGPVYQQFKERQTPPLSELLRTRRAEMLHVVAALKEDPHHVEPLPPSLEKLLAEAGSVDANGGGAPLPEVSNPLGSALRARP